MIAGQHRNRLAVGRETEALVLGDGLQLINVAQIHLLIELPAELRDLIVQGQQGLLKMGDVILHAAHASLNVLNVAAIFDLHRAGRDGARDRATRDR